VTYLFFGLIGAAWLVPNHYLPWLAAWNDALAIFGLLLLLSFSLSRTTIGRISWSLASVAAIIGVMPWLQFTTGKLMFAGDALMVSWYVGLWLAALVAGRLLAESSKPHDGLSPLMVAWLVAAMLSIGIALVQYTGAVNLGIYAAELPPGARPFANLAQPNNFSTACFIGLCSLLWLHQLKRVNNGVLAFGAAFLLLGMVLSQSRTAWLQMGLLLLWGFAMHKRSALRITQTQLITMGGAFAACVALLPWVTDILLLRTGRTLDDQMQAGVRLPYWREMLDAISREPWLGYGWQQIGSAQQRVALDHLSVGDYFEHAHNLVLDLMLWNGVPIGGLIVVLLIWWFVSRIRACQDARIVWLMAAVGGVFTHAMLELPLEYAYFLIPVGLMMGGIDGLTPSHETALRVPRWAGLIGTGVLTLGFVAIASDYAKAEENYRILRLESARIGVAGIVTPAPQLRLLTQLEAFLQFARIEATPNMKPSEVEWMRKVALRFGSPPVLFRYALATGLNGQPEAASQTLARICRIHPPERCQEAHDGWIALQAKYSQLAGIKAPQQ